MAYSGKNPLSRICLFNCRKSGTPYGKPETCHRHDPNHLAPGETIVPLTDQEVELLIRMGGDKEQLVRLSQGIIEGDQVHIISGPLQGMEGAIRKIDRHKRIAVLSLDMFGRTVDMKVGLEIISKVTKKEEFAVTNEKEKN